MLRVLEDFEIRALHSENLRKEREKWFISAREHKERKELRAEQAEEEFLDFAASAILATEIEVQEFQAKLDTYDEATVKALMENQEALDHLQLQITEMLSSAHVTEDGTRVFKSEDGTWAVDEHGQRLDNETHDIDSIPQTKVTAEEYHEVHEQKKQLMQERQELHDYQEKLDNARQRSNSDDFTKDELDALDKELEADMPEAVKRQLPDYEPTQETSLKSSFDASAEHSLSELPAKAVTQTIAPAMQ